MFFFWNVPKQDNEKYNPQIKRARLNRSFKILFNNISLAQIEEHSKKNPYQTQHKQRCFLSKTKTPLAKPQHQLSLTDSLPWFILTLPLVSGFFFFQLFCSFFSASEIGIQKCCVMYSGSPLLFQFPCLNYDWICHIHMIQILIFFI